ncbi:hypothetical protein RRG08_033101 [Elysia crispata]|uniref:Thioredoxin domain-containing protein n=1 Tax=Elysia crispata TaxID=231223 RepID=A0AAE1BAA0_9GAST|nr:hypothetical protein RRG08_033101 [Elysia crispata]
MNRFAVTVLVILITLNFSTGFFFGGDVLVLKQDNFANALTENDFLLVMFYSPKCGYSRILSPNFDTAASLLSDEDIPIKSGKVDCTEEVQLRKTYHIRRYPTLKLFRHGQPLQYAGSIPTYDLAPHDIANWAKENIANYVNPQDKTLEEEGTEG